MGLTWISRRASPSCWAYWGLRSRPAALVGEVGEAIDKAFLELPPQIIPGALDTLDKVKRGGFRIALLSNTGMNSETLYDYWLERIGLSSYFDYIFLSSRKGAGEAEREGVSGRTARVAS